MRALDLEVCECGLAVPFEPRAQRGTCPRCQRALRHRPTEHAPSEAARAAARRAAQAFVIAHAVLAPRDGRPERAALAICVLGSAGTLAAAALFDLSQTGALGLFAAICVGVTVPVVALAGRRHRARQEANRTRTLAALPPVAEQPCVCGHALGVPGSPSPAVASCPACERELVFLHAVVLPVAASAADWREAAEARLAPQLGFEEEE